MNALIDLIPGRDLARVWRGWSGLAVAVGATALIVLARPDRTGQRAVVALSAGFALATAAVALVASETRYPDDSILEVNPVTFDENAFTE